MFYHIAVVAQTAAQTVDMTTNGWIVLGVIFGIMAVIAILLMLPSKDIEALENEEKKNKPAAIKFDEKKALIDETEEVVDNSRKSLSQIKVAKRAVVSEEKSKEELRELRKARRAAAQTEKAIQEREVKASEKSVAEDEVSDADSVKEEQKEVLEDVKVEKPEVVAEKSEIEAEKSEIEAEKSEIEAEKPEIAPEKSETSNDETVQKSEVVTEDLASQVLKLTENTELSSESAVNADSNDLMVDATANTEDMYATLFGDEQSKDSVSFDDIFGGTSKNVDDGTIFPTLGSALIPLNAIEKAANQTTNDVLDELSRKFSDSAEKKTPR